MRFIRSPFSLHKKNQEKYGKYHQPPLVDVIGTYFDGSTANEETNINFILDCMWDLEKAMTGLVYDFLIHAHWKPKHIRTSRKVRFLKLPGFHNPV